MDLTAHKNSRRDKKTVTLQAKIDLDLVEGLVDLAERLKLPKSLLINEAVRDYLVKMKDAEFGHPL